MALELGTFFLFFLEFILAAISGFPASSTSVAAVHTAELLVETWMGSMTTGVTLIWTSLLGCLVVMTLDPFQSEQRRRAPPLPLPLPVSGIPRSDILFPGLSLNWSWDGFEWALNCGIVALSFVPSTVFIVDYYRIERYKLTSHKQDLARRIHLRHCGPYLSPNIQPRSMDHLPPRDSVSGNSVDYLGWSVANPPASP